jgi:putative GTP pyrophosphokinase
LKYVNENKLPEKIFLEKISYKTILQRSLKNTSLSKVSLEDLMADMKNYIDTINQTMTGIDQEIIKNKLEFSFRIKSLQSIKMKYNKNIQIGRPLASSMNDIISIRIIVDSYDLEIPDYFRVVDLRKGKSIDDGYRGIHLYFSKSNVHYPIEVQIWDRRDAKFNTWSHIYSYKYVDSRIGRLARELYEIGKINNEKQLEEFILEVSNNGVYDCKRF